jgi:DMSO/TMAO reductase YedYZ molybdopterin-dependent catalytic subunit
MGADDHVGHRHTAWHDLLALPSESLVVDIHCVTRWSKLATQWRMSLRYAVLAAVDTEATHVMVSSYGGYTTNLPLTDLRGGKPGSPTGTTDKARRVARRSGPSARPAPVLLEVGQMAERTAAKASYESGWCGCAAWRSDRGEASAVDAGGV